VPSDVMPCPVLAGGTLCPRPGGHDGSHEPAVLPLISGRRLAVIARRMGQGRAARCPGCRAAIGSRFLGVPAGPALDDRGRQVVEYPVTFAPCACRFRRVQIAGQG